MKQIFILVSFAVAGFAGSAQSIPSWKITDVVNYYSKKTDSVYVIDFWGTFCKPCVAELSFIQDISKKYADKKVRLLLVSLDLKAHYPARIIQFAKNHQIAADIAWLNETDADYFCNMIDKEWSGSIPALLMVNAATGYKQFYEEEFTAAEFEAELKKAVGEGGGP